MKIEEVQWLTYKSTILLLILTWFNFEGKFKSVTEIVVSQIMHAYFAEKNDAKVHTELHLKNT